MQVWIVMESEMEGDQIMSVWSNEHSDHIAMERIRRDVDKRGFPCWSVEGPFEINPED